MTAMRRLVHPSAYEGDISRPAAFRAIAFDRCSQKPAGLAGGSRFSPE